MTTLPLQVQSLAACIATWIARHQEGTIAWIGSSRSANDIFGE